VAQLSTLGIIRAMRYSAILLAVAMLALSACSRTSEFRKQAELGQPIVRAIEDYHKQTGSYPAALADLAPKYLAAAPDIPDKTQHKFIGWDYSIVTNAAEISYSLRYYMGHGGIEYKSPDWIGDDEGSRTVVLSNR
jgi:hypothetical protein